MNVGSTPSRMVMRKPARALQCDHRSRNCKSKTSVSEGTPLQESLTILDASSARTLHHNHLMRRQIAQPQPPIAFLVLRLHENKVGTIASRVHPFIGASVRVSRRVRLMCVAVSRRWRTRSQGRAWHRLAISLAARPLTARLFRPRNLMAPHMKAALLFPAAVQRRFGLRHRLELMSGWFCSQAET